ncbi:MAG: triose-phosphate isomerase [Flavobacteriales bacterium]
MRNYIVAGNWKMNTTIAEGIQLAEELNDILPVLPESHSVILAPPSTHIYPVQGAIEGSQMELAAQNCFSKNSGAFTGEISPSVLSNFGLSYVILGHSERRQYFGETSSILKEKVDSALENNLQPIFCIGESLDQRESGEYHKILLSQLEESVFHLSENAFSNVVIAYEPVWAIGTGVTASADQAEEVHAFLRQEIAKKYSLEIANATTILYGGSCKPSNANEIFAKPNVDGGLIGGAALKSEDFVGIIEALISQKA